MEKKKRVSSYQRMKQKYEKKISELQSDIEALRGKRGFCEQRRVEETYNMIEKMEEYRWSGDTDNVGNGIFNEMKQYVSGADPVHDDTVDATAFSVKANHWAVKKPESRWKRFRQWISSIFKRS